ncbi:hypothetical protein HPB50_027063 [Hyalomma asiaticum]|uniref:Uncharacterized protein n=1 Tax=Hyalomma asiaticum TaxID=266040 RepID=A0ACB7RPU2_HYAAI|nr:hypothetical protein HPB50_027063 [Hyalomma asiaticum]
MSGPRQPIGGPELRDNSSKRNKASAPSRITVSRKRRVAATTSLGERFSQPDPLVPLAVHGVPSQQSPKAASFERIRAAPSLFLLLGSKLAQRASSAAPTVITTGQPFSEAALSGKRCSQRQ